MVFVHHVAYHGHKSEQWCRGVWFHSKLASDRHETEQTAIETELDNEAAFEIRTVAAQ